MSQMLKITVLKVVWKSGRAAAAFAREAGLEETQEQPGAKPWQEF